MKTLKYFGMTMLTMMMAFSMAACGGSNSDDEDDSGGGGSGGTASTKGWEGDWLITVDGDIYTHPSSIQVLRLDRSTGKFYSIYYMTEDGEFFGGSIAYGSLTVNEKKGTMTMNGVTMEYEIEGNEITWYGGNTHTTYRRLTSEQKKMFETFAEKAGGNVYTYEIQPGQGGVIPGGSGGGDDDNGGGSSTSSIVGSWYVVEEDTGTTSYEIMTFKSNGTLVITIVFGYDDVWYKSSQSGTYKVSGNQLTINVAGDKGSGTWSVSGNKLIIDGETFYKVDAKVQAIIDSATEYDL